MPTTTTATSGERATGDLSAQYADLIERLEKATGPDRELDALIVIALDIRPDWLRKSKGEMWLDAKSPVGPCVRFKNDCIKRRDAGNPPIGDFMDYTASIEAALTLVLDPWVWELTWDGFCELSTPPDDNQKVITAIGNTPSIALCIAALKARATSSALGTPVVNPPSNEATVVAPTSPPSESGVGE